MRTITASAQAAITPSIDHMPASLQALSDGFAELEPATHALRRPRDLPRFKARGES